MAVQISYIERIHGRLRIGKPEVLLDEDGLPFESIDDYCSACDDETFFMSLRGDARAAVLGRGDPAVGELFALANEGDDGWSNTLALLIEAS